MEKNIYDSKGTKYEIKRQILKSEEFNLYELEGDFVAKVYSKTYSKDWFVDRYNWILDNDINSKISIVKLVGIIKKPTVGYIMEYISGVNSLEKNIRSYSSSENFSLSKKIECLIKICEEIRGFHQLNLSYVNLTPNRILTTKSMKKIFFIDGENIIQSNSLEKINIEENMYNHPKLIERSIVQSEKTDVYSIAAILFEMLSTKDIINVYEFFEEYKEKKELDYSREIENIIATDELKKLLRDTLVYGKKDLNKIQSIESFIEELTKTKDIIIGCSHRKCQNEFYYNKEGNNKCYICEKNSSNISKIEINKVIKIGFEKVGELLINNGIKYIEERHLFKTISTKRILKLKSKNGYLKIEKIQEDINLLREEKGRYRSIDKELKLGKDMDIILYSKNIENTFRIDISFENKEVY